jgi:hypothetical protein
MCDCKIVTVKYILWCKNILDLPKRYDRAVLKKACMEADVKYIKREKQIVMCRKSRYPCTRSFVLHGMVSRDLGLAHVM